MLFNYFSLSILRIYLNNKGGKLVTVLVITVSLRPAGVTLFCFFPVNDISIDD